MAISSLQTVGTCLVISMLVTPGTSAYLLTNKFSRLILISCTIGALTGFFGVYASYFIDAPTGAVIVLLQIIVFLFALLISPKYGLWKKTNKKNILE